MIQTLRILLCNFLFFFVLPCLAQDISSLPKLTPSYSEDFVDFKSFPSVCFEDVCLDQAGRLWLQTCGSAGQSRIHLFQFDGYEFKLPKGDIENLPTQVTIYTKTPDNKLVGRAKEEGEVKVFFLDLETNEVEKVSLPEKVDLQYIYLNEKQQVVVYCRTEKYWIRYDWSEGQFVEYARMDVPAYLIGLPEHEILFASGEEAWLASGKADHLIRINIREKELTSFKEDAIELPPSQGGKFDLFRALIKECDGELYLECGFIDRTHVLYKLDKSTDKFIPVKNFPFDVNAISIFPDKVGNKVILFRREENGLYEAILEDAEGRRFDYSAFFSGIKNGWIHKLVSPNFKKQLIVATTRGVEVHRVAASESIENVLEGNSIRMMRERKDGKVLVLTQESTRSYLLDPNTLEVSRFALDGLIVSWKNTVEDESGNLWSFPNSKTLTRYSMTTSEYENFTVPEALHGIIAEKGIGEFIYIAENEEKKKRVMFYNVRAKKSTQLLIENEELFVDGYIQNMYYSKRSDALYVATNRGLYQFDFKNQKKKIFGFEAPFLDSRFLSVTEDKNGKIWAGTPLGGLYIYDPNSGEIETINSSNGLCNNTVASIVSDNDGDMWIGTYNGIGLVSTEGELITNLYAEDGLVNREANRYATLKLNDGTILLGTVSGLNIIDPKGIKSRVTKNEDLKIFLNSISYYDSSIDGFQTIDYGLNSLGTIVLPASNRDLSLSFSTSNYFKSGNNQYAYKINHEGSDWVPIGGQHNLNLNNLPVGEYDLLLKGSDDRGNWTKEPIALNIHAKEFFYKQAWFYFLLFAFAGALIFIWITRLQTEVRKATKKIREDKEIIEEQAEQLKELDLAKSRFFTNISHEFRTPLTIISGMVDQVRNKPEKWHDRGTRIIKENTLSLLNLINQILDLRKLESKNLKLNMMQGDIIHYLRYVKESYQSYAENVGQQLHFLTAEYELIMDYDPDKILRIISNLLSNAIKYNKPDGHIYFHVDKILEGEKEGEYLRIRVQDNGEGIPENKLEDIFGRFFQVNQPGEKKIVGSGIGLALTHELVDLLDGKIDVDSKVGAGTTFTVLLPITRNADLILPNEDEPLVKVESEMVAAAAKEPKLNSEDLILEEDSELPTVLIVEDNPQIVQVLIATLEDEYQLKIASNGQIGIDMALEHIPDLIISDVMMPEKDGFELTDTLKGDERTDHIPIIILTAKGDIESKLSGLGKGADAYLAKPFEERELKIRMKKLLELRRKLQARYAEYTTGKPTPPAKIEDPFLQKVHTIIEKELSNPSFDVNRLGRAMKLSRSQIFRKVKALTGKSPTLLIRTVRLHKAKEMLTTTDLSTSDIAKKVGFSTLNYFSAAFSKEFGVRPSETRK